MLCAQRVDGHERHIPQLVFGRRKDLAGTVEAQGLQRHTQAPREFCCQIDRGAARLAAGGVGLRQHRVAQVDRSAQGAAGRQVAQDVGGGHGLDFFRAALRAGLPSALEASRSLA